MWEGWTRMKPEVLNAIASLWKLIFIIVVFILSLVFKKQIMGLLERMSSFKVKKGDAEFSVTKEYQFEETENLLMSKISEKTVSEIEVTEDNNQEIEYKNKTDEYFSILLDAYNDRDREKMEESYIKLQEAETDATQRLKNEAIYYNIRFRAGIIPNQNELYELVERVKSCPDAHQYVMLIIGNNYNHISNYDKASKAYDISANLCTEPKEIASRISLSAKSLYEDGKKSDAFNKLMVEISKTKDLEALCELYKGLASLYKQDDNKDLQAVALEKVLENNPSDINSRFDMAYAYGEFEFYTISLMHYKTLLSFQKDNAGAINNLAVAYDNNDLKIKSIDLYKESFQLKNSLAGANLAYKYISSGLAEEASSILDQAKQEKDIHPNVFSAITHLSEVKKKEQDKEENILKSAHKQQSFLMLFGDAYFSYYDKLIDLNGNWTDREGIIYSIKHNSILIEANWSINNTKYKFSGELCNRGIKFTNYKWSYLLTNFEKDTSGGYAYLSEDLKTIFIMKVNSKDFNLITISKLEEDIQNVN